MNKKSTGLYVAAFFGACTMNGTAPAQAANLTADNLVQTEGARTQVEANDGGLSKDVEKKLKGKPAPGYQPTVSMKTGTEVTGGNASMTMAQLIALRQQQAQDPKNPSAQKASEEEQNTSEKLDIKEVVTP